MYRDLDFAYEAISQLESETGYIIDFTSHRESYHVILGIRGNAFYGRCQRNAKNINAGILSDKIRSLNKTNAILIADYLTGRTARELKKNSINYLDASGNAFIKTDNLYIYISGKKNKQKTATNEPRAFQEAGLKLLMTLVSEPQTLQYSYRDLAEISQVSIGSITHVFNELEENKFLLRTEEKRVLKNTDSLIEQWVIAFGTVLKPRYFRKRFRSKSAVEVIERRISDSDLNLDIGGEWAADKLTGHLISDSLTLFSNEEPARIVKELQLLPDDEGNIELYGKFWSDKLSEKYNRLAPPLVIYSELMNTGRERNIETAKLILANGL